MKSQIITQKRNFKKLSEKLWILITLILVSCSPDDSNYNIENSKNSSAANKPTINNPVAPDKEIRAADMSYLPLIESEGTIYKHAGIAENALTTLKNAGCNTIRIRLWHSPADGHSGLAEARALALRVKAAGLKVWLTVHYSDTWADPGNQTKPAAWSALNFANLKIAVSDYTAMVMTQINPDIIQIGNETNDGMLWPEGKLSTNENQYRQLVTAASTAVRAQSTKTKIMLHFAGITNSDWYFSKVGTLDFDYIGLSYYPIWHGTSLTNLQIRMNTLGNLYNKKVIIAETAYPFTLGYNDFTNNIVGLSSQIIPAYPATPAGQKSFLLALRNMVKTSSNGIGFCYWGGEWVAFRGPTATNGSTFENQALWDFQNNSVTAMDAFTQNLN